MIPLIKWKCTRRRAWRASHIDAPEILEARVRKSTNTHNTFTLVGAIFTKTFRHVFGHTFRQLYEIHTAQFPIMSSADVAWLCCLCACLCHTHTHTRLALHFSICISATVNWCGTGCFVCVRSSSSNNFRKLWTNAMLAAGSFHSSPSPKWRNHPSFTIIGPAN